MSSVSINFNQEENSITVTVNSDVVAKVKVSNGKLEIVETKNPKKSIQDFDCNKFTEYKIKICDEKPCKDLYDIWSLSEETNHYTIVAKNYPSWTWYKYHGADSEDDLVNTLVEMLSTREFYKIQVINEKGKVVLKAKR